MGSLLHEFVRRHGFILFSRQSIIPFSKQYGSIGTPPQITTNIIASTEGSNLLRTKTSTLEDVGCNRVIHTIYKTGELDEQSTCAEIAQVQKLCLCVKTYAAMVGG